MWEIIRKNLELRPFVRNLCEIMRMKLSGTIAGKQFDRVWKWICVFSVDGVMALRGMDLVGKQHIVREAAGWVG